MNKKILYLFALLCYQQIAFSSINQALDRFSIAITNLIYEKLSVRTPDEKKEKPYELPYKELDPAEYVVKILEPNTPLNQQQPLDAYRTISTNVGQVAAEFNLKDEDSYNEFVQILSDNFSKKYKGLSFSDFDAIYTLFSDTNKQLTQTIDETIKLDILKTMVLNSTIQKLYFSNISTGKTKSQFANYIDHALKELIPYTSGYTRFTTWTIGALYSQLNTNEKLSTNEIKSILKAMVTKAEFDSKIDGVNDNAPLKGNILYTYFRIKNFINSCHTTVRTLGKVSDIFGKEFSIYLSLAESIQAIILPSNENAYAININNEGNKREIYLQQVLKNNAQPFMQFYTKHPYETEVYLNKVLSSGTIFGGGGSFTSTIGSLFNYSKTTLAGEAKAYWEEQIAEGGYLVGKRGKWLKTLDTVQSAIKKNTENSEVHALYTTAKNELNAIIEHIKNNLIPAFGAFDSAIKNNSKDILNIKFTDVANMVENYRNANAKVQNASRTLAQAHNTLFDLIKTYETAIANAAAKENVSA